MGYIQRKGRGMMGFGDASTCGPGTVSPNQVWYPNLTCYGVTGQCSTPAQAAAGLASGACTGSISTGGGGGGGSSWWEKILGSATDVLKAKAQPGQTTFINQPAGGIGTVGYVALAGAGVLALVLLTRKKK